MGCDNRNCKFQQNCRLNVNGYVDYNTDCLEYLHWEDMALDAENARMDYQDYDDEPDDDDFTEDDLL